MQNRIVGSGFELTMYWNQGSQTIIPSSPNLTSVTMHPAEGVLQAHTRARYYKTNSRRWRTHFHCCIVHSRSSLHHLNRVARLDLVIKGFMGSTTVKTKQRSFLTDGINRNNTFGCLLIFLAYVCNWLSVVLSNSSGQHPSVSIPQFRGSADSG